MTLKKFDLAKNLGLKVAGQMKARGVPDRFAQGAAEALDKRERRARDAAAGLVPFACKLPGDLVKQLHERAATQDGGLNVLMVDLLSPALAGEEQPKVGKPAPKKAASKKAAAKTAKASGDGMVE